MKSEWNDLAQSRVAIGFVAVLVFALCFVGWRIGDREHSDPIRVHKISFQAAPGTSPADTRNKPEAPGEVVTVRVTADATTDLKADEEALRTLQEGVTAAFHAASKDNMQDSSPDWMVWSRLRGVRIPVLAAPVDNILVYASRVREGATIVLINRSVQKMPTSVLTRLPRGLYKIERMTITPTTEKTADKPVSPESLLHPAFRLDMLEGRELARTNNIIKPWTLEPGQVCIYRYTDVSYAARAAYQELHESLRRMYASFPTASTRIRNILRQGSSALGALETGTERGDTARLAGVHRLLLLTAQAQSINRNNMERRVVSPESGAIVMGGLERFSDALTETSAALLGLVANISIQPDTGTPPSVRRENGLKTAALQTLSRQESTPRAAYVILSLSNSGTRSVGLVKVGLDVSGLPAGVACAPSDPELFGTVRPGQTVRAMFRLHGLNTGDALSHWCVGDISYFAQGAAAHLRPRLW